MNLHEIKILIDELNYELNEELDEGFNMDLRREGCRSAAGDMLGSEAIRRE
jgi:hypothetical protein